MRIYPVFLSNAGCPQRCIFCNQSAAEKVRPWKKSVEDALFYLDHSNLVYDEVALYGGTPTSDLSFLIELLEPFERFWTTRKIQGIRLSTRPDEINEDVVKVMVNYHVTTVEIGVESFSDSVLNSAERGYCVNDILNAHRLLSERFNEVFQLMVGLPHETDADRELTINRTLQLHPWGIRYFPTLVLKGTKLERLYREGHYEPLTIEQAIFWSKKAYNSFRNAGIRVLQIGLHSSDFLSEELVAGPYAGNFGELVRGDC
jgi:histone acetyltransferase (RNA polymerase elongator complex component)